MTKKDDLETKDLTIKPMNPLVNMGPTMMHLKTHSNFRMHYIHPL